MPKVAQIKVGAFMLKEYSWFFLKAHKYILLPIYLIALNSNLNKMN